MSRLRGEDREQRNKLRCLVVGQIREDEGFGVVLVDSVYLSARVAWCRSRTACYVTCSAPPQAL